MNRMTGSVSTLNRHVRNAQKRAVSMVTQYVQHKMEGSKRRYLERMSYIDRGFKGLSFVIRAWMYQCSISMDRGRVWLSLLRNLPLLDAGRYELFEKISREKIPLLLIWGKEDSILPASLVLEFQRYIPHVHVEILDGDHGVFLQKPNKIFSLIYRFISTSHIE